jgi:hypothetical protein
MEGRRTCLQVPEDLRRPAEAPMTLDDVQDVAAAIAFDALAMHVGNWNLRGAKVSMAPSTIKSFGARDMATLIHSKV